jgi:AraC-like DNA-binding protein
MTVTTPDFSSFHFSTRELPPAQRLPTWDKAFGRPLSRRILWLSDSPFDLEVTGHTLGRGAEGADSGAGVCAMRMTMMAGGTIRRPPEIVSHGNDDIILQIHESGRRVVSQFGRQATVEPGGAIIASNADPSTIVLSGPARFFSIGVPRKLMTTLAPGVEDALVRPLPADAGVVRLLIRYLGILDDARALATTQLRRAVTSHIHDLCTLVIGATRDAAEIARERGLKAARLRAIKADIETNLVDGDVSAAALARRQRVTPRYIHKLFEREGMTLSHFVLGQRLALARGMLTNPRHAHRTISSVAFDVGFGDLSTFNHGFRRHFGATPSDVRAAALAPA